MHPRLRELTEHLARSRRMLLEAVERIPGAARDRVPPGGGWSAAQVVEHLAMTDRDFTRRLRAGIAAERAKGAGPDPDHSPVLEALGLRGVALRRQHVAAPEHLLPGADVTMDDALAHLAQARAEFLATIAAAEDISLAVPTETHFALGELSLYRWIALTGYHEQRHALQLREMAEAPSS